MLSSDILFQLHLELESISARHTQHLGLFNLDVGSSIREVAGSKYLYDRDKVQHKRSFRTRRVRGRETVVSVSRRFQLRFLLRNTATIYITKVSLAAEFDVFIKAKLRIYEGFLSLASRSFLLIMLLRDVMHYDF